MDQLDWKFLKQREIGLNRRQVNKIQSQCGGNRLNGLFFRGKAERYSHLVQRTVGDLGFTSNLELMSVKQSWLAH